MNKFLSLITNRKQTFINSDIQNQAKQIFNLLDISEETKKDYQYRIKLFLDFIGDKGFNRNSFLEYKCCLKERNDLTAASKNKYLATSRVFLKELNRQGFIHADITQNIKAFSQNKKHKNEGLNSEEINLLIQTLNNLTLTRKNQRLKAIISLLTLQGLRECEIIRLDVNDIDMASRTAFVRGKGQDDRELINLHPETVNVLKEYLKSHNIADGALFVSVSNNSRGQRLTTRGLRIIVKEILDNLDIDKHVHGFRHYFVSKLIKSYGGDLLEVARYTRHKSLEMLQVYNDNIKLKADLPRYYKVFEEVKF